MKVIVRKETIRERDETDVILDEQEWSEWSEYVQELKAKIEKWRVVKVGIVVSSSAEAIRRAPR